LLTEAAVRKATAEGARREIADGGGLYLVVQPSGAKSWAVRYRRNGRTRKLTLGSVDLKTARQLAKKALDAVALGGDPGTDKAEARREEASDKRDFEAVAALFLERYVNKKNLRPRPRTLEEQARLLGMTLTENGWAAKKGGLAHRWRGRKVSEITKSDIVDRLDEQLARHKGANANRLRIVLHLFFGWCVRRDLIAVNPCAGTDRPAPQVSRDRVLTDAELALFWRAANLDPLFGPMWKLLALTGQRRDEARGATWSEFDLEARTWTIPADRAKNSHEHEVPLSPAAIALLEVQPRIGKKPTLVFTTTGDTMLGGLSRAKDRLDRRMAELAAVGGLKEPPRPWRIHDLRRTVATGLQKLGVNLPVIEKVLNHTSGSFAGVVGIYQRHDFRKEKRDALDAWDRHITSLVEQRENNVTPIRRPA
jgi:integrase